MQTIYAPTSTNELMLGDDRRQEEGPLRRYCHYFSFDVFRDEYCTYHLPF